MRRWDSVGFLRRSSTSFAPYQPFPSRPLKECRAPAYHTDTQTKYNTYHQHVADVWK